MTTLHSRKSIGRSLSWRCGFVLIPLALAYFALVQNTQAVDPPPDGGYPGANTAEGADALFSLTTGIANTAVGQHALHDNTTGGWNVAIGSSALANNTTGNFNMAVGTDALRDSTANFNLAIGFRVGFMNTTGNHLTGIGAGALFSNTIASFNTAIGSDALHTNTTGEDNTAIGAAALSKNDQGGNNTATGFQALQSNNGDDNNAFGAGALQNNTTGNGNIALGNDAGFNLTVGNNNIDIGNSGVAGESGIIRIGTAGTHTNTFLTGNVDVPGSLVLQGQIHVPGAGIGTNRAVFIHRATAANSTFDWTTIFNPNSDGDPNAILFVTPNWNPGGVGGVYNNHPIGVFFVNSGPFAGHWAIFNQDLTAIPLNAAFNVMIVKP